MAKGQMKSNREKRKPKSDKTKVAAAPTSIFAQAGGPGGAKGKSGKKAR